MNVNGLVNVYVSGIHPTSSPVGVQWDISKLSVEEIIDGLERR